MSKRAFDIVPPGIFEPPKTEQKGQQKKKSSPQNFLIFLFGLFFIFVIFGFVKFGDFDSSFSKKTEKDKNNQNSNFELFNQNGESNFTNPSKSVSIRLLNGAKDTNNLTIGKDLLLKKGYIIEKTINAEKNYELTTIYYSKGQLAIAQKVAESLKPNFSPIFTEKNRFGKKF